MTTSTREHMDLHIVIETSGLEVNSNRARRYSIRLESKVPERNRVHVAEGSDLTLGELIEALAAIDRSHSLHPHFTIPHLSDSGTELGRVDRK